MATKREKYRTRLDGLAAGELEPFLLRESGLPGRRANLELAAALADHLAAAGPLDDDGWGLLSEWLALDADRAPTNSAREYLPFCAAQALGACHAAAPPARRDKIVTALRAAAADPRWRMREAVCFGLQRVGDHDPEALLALLDGWWPEASPLERRAILVTLAHPPLLAAHPEAAERALELAEEALLALAALEEQDDGQAAKGEQARVMRKCLEFVPSVVTAAAPEAGFARLSRWAGQESPTIKKIVVANLRKARLAKHFPDEIEGVVDALSWC